jgi:hypothetical protein
MAFLSAALLPDSKIAHASEAKTLRIVGGLDGVKQYRAFEEPFRRTGIARRSSSAITALIHPFDRSGLRGQDMLQLIRLGVVPFGAAHLPVAGGTGLAMCPGSGSGRMTRVPLTDDDKARSRELLREVVLPRWIARCGAPCVVGWNATLAACIGLSVTGQGVVTTLQNRLGGLLRTLAMSAPTDAPRSSRRRIEL